MSRLAWFVLGVVVTLIGIVAGAYLFISLGGAPMGTAAHPLPFERTVARLALHASYGNAAAQQNPLPFDEANMVAGARIFRTHCAVCHGRPGEPKTPIARGMFPPPPQLFEKGEMVTDDPEGITFWKVTNGIRLTGMPRFVESLGENERWQVTLLVSHADRLAPAVLSALQEK